MDYKYIENLIERYFECKTNTQEEQILRSFFQQDEIPEKLAQYQPLFATLAEEAEATLPADFDAKLGGVIADLNRAGSTSPLAITMVKLNRTLRPFYKAVASVAIIVTTGVVANSFMSKADSDNVDYNYAEYKDTDTDPQVAYSQVSDALKDLSEALSGNNVLTGDSAAALPSLQAQ